ncbi:MAG: hypothetical protein WAN30_07005 [Acidimicrobiales bacterium]
MLVRAFGLVEVAVYGDGDDVGYAQMNWPLGGGVMLASARDPEGNVWSLGAYWGEPSSPALASR